MDPDAEAGQTASTVLKGIFITVVFTACQTHKTEPGVTVFKTGIRSMDSIGRTAFVALPKKKKKKTIYLTFDDGPNKGTKKLMHIIDEEQVRVTVFIIGEHVYGSREQRNNFDSLLQNRFFEIANHSFTHAFHNKYARFYTLPDSAFKDFIRCADSLHLTARIIRLPGRNIWRTGTINSTDIKASKLAADMIREKGFTEMGWDLEWQFDKQLKLKNTSDEMLQQVDSMFANGKTKTPGQLVFLAHDQVFEDVGDSSELHQFIKKLKATDEYDFETVSRYPGIKN